MLNQRGTCSVGAGLSGRGNRRLLWPEVGAGRGPAGGPSPAVRRTDPWGAGAAGLAVAAAVAVALVALGLCLAAARTAMVAPPVLEFRYYGPIEGRIIAVDRSTSDLPRITLDRVRLDAVAPERTPARVRLSCRANSAGSIRPGNSGDADRASGAAQWPGRAGRFRFRRVAWSRVGGGGIYLQPGPDPAAADDGAALWLSQLRLRLSAGIMALIPGDAGGFVAAVLTGTGRASRPK